MHVAQYAIYCMWWQHAQLNVWQHALLNPRIAPEPEHPDWKCFYFTNCWILAWFYKCGAEQTSPFKPNIRLTSFPNNPKCWLLSAKWSCIALFGSFIFLYFWIFVLAIHVFRFVLFFLKLGKGALFDLFCHICLTSVCILIACVENKS